MRISSRTLLAESAIAATLILGISSLVWPDTLGMDAVGFHPAWLGIIALAARYGPFGLFTGLPIVWAPLAGISFLEAGGDWVIWERIIERSDLFPLVTAVAVAWVTISHQSRLSRADELLGAAESELATTRAWAEALQESLAYLRGRCDRIDVSVSFWRRLGECLERGEAAQAADAALELCMIRTGAKAGRVELCGDAPGICLARRGSWPAGDVSADATIAAAIRAGATRDARALPGATEADCDVAFPVRDRLGDGSVIGVIALRGVEPAWVKPAELSDLELIGEWLSPAIARHVRGPRLRSVTEDYAKDYG